MVSCQHSHCERLVQLSVQLQLTRNSGSVAMLTLGSCVRLVMYSNWSGYSAFNKFIHCGRGVCMRVCSVGYYILLSIRRTCAY